ncbi:MAG TPA: hypothetical protein VGG61_09020 [Gemmataceae bacterium]|jgi:hypothetical protein
MSRKSFVLGIGIAVVLASAVSGVLVLLVRSEPSAYSRVAAPAGEARETCSKEFVSGLTDLMNYIQWEDAASAKEWEVVFTEQQINSFLDEDFVHSGMNEKLLPECISEPRVAIERDRLRVMFRYGSGAWSTVISIDLNVWLAGKEPNVVALELKSFRAGSLPISAQSLLERISDGLRRNSVEVSWYRYNGNPVAVLHFQSDPPNSFVQLKNLTLEEGQITLHGSSADDAGALLLVPFSPRRAWERSMPGRALALR